MIFSLILGQYFVGHIIHILVVDHDFDTYHISYVMWIPNLVIGIINLTKSNKVEEWRGIFIVSGVLVILNDFFGTRDTLSGIAFKILIDEQVFPVRAEIKKY